MPLSDSEEWILAQNSGGTKDKYKSFLEMFSHRCLKEVDNKLWFLMFKVHGNNILIICSSI